MIGTEWHLNVVNVLIVTTRECIVLQVHRMLHMLIMDDRAWEHPWLLLLEDHSHSCFDRLLPFLLVLIIGIEVQLLLAVTCNILGACDAHLRVVPAS